MVFANCVSVVTIFRRNYRTYCIAACSVALGHIYLVPRRSKVILNFYFLDNLLLKIAKYCNLLL